MQATAFFNVLIAFCVGVAVETMWPVSLVTIVWGLFVGFILAIIWRRQSHIETKPRVLLASISVIAFSLGLLRTEVASWQFGISPLADLVGEEVALTGVVSTEPDRREKTTQFYLRTKTDKVLVSTDRLTALSYGDVVTVSGQLEQPEVFTTEYGRTFNYPGYLKAKGVEYRVSFAEVVVAGSGEGNPIIERLLTIKQIFLRTLAQALPEPATSLGAGLLLGVQSSLGEDIEEDFRRTGIIHIVVLSGYNIMLVVAFILFCLAYLLPLRSRLVVASVAILFFVLMVGLSATVVRAGIMSLLILLAQFLGRRYDVLRALALAGVVMLIHNPYLLVYDIGFQLSFMATLGLVLILPQFEKAVVEGGRVGIREFFLSTVATQIAVLPLLLYHIGQVSLIAVIVNVLVLPIVPIAMLLTFATGMLGLITVEVARIIGYAATVSLDYILAVARWFADLPFAAVVVPVFSGWGVLGLYGVMVFVWWWRKTKGEDKFSDWVIEEEEMVGAGAGQGQAPAPTMSSNNLPIFFR